MPLPTPNIVVLAGRNGSGKSTVAPALLRDYLGITEFVNADVMPKDCPALDRKMSPCGQGGLCWNG